MEPKTNSDATSSLGTNQLNSKDEFNEIVDENTKSQTLGPLVDIHQVYDSRHEFVGPALEEKKNVDLSWFQDTVINLPNEMLESKEKVPRWIKAKEKLLKRQQKLNLELSNQEPSTTTTDGGGPVTINEIVDTLKEHAAIDINVINVSEKVDHMEALIVCHGSSERHVYSIADSIRILVLFFILFNDF